MKNSKLFLLLGLIFLLFTSLHKNVYASRPPIVVITPIENVIYYFLVKNVLNDNINQDLNKYYLLKIDNKYISPIALSDDSNIKKYLKPNITLLIISPIKNNNYPQNKVFQKYYIPLHYQFFW